ncbi:MAG TPA: competence/damage-inducible protein A [Acidimicrobiales bacterium]|nr:competence/damage-inducible protein A [Acidimicrobiales bacterium]
MRAEIVAVGTELLLGQIVDTNSTWIAQRLAAAGIDCNYQTRVGDNIGRVADVLRIALSRAEAVVVCGGLGPTQDDLTREAIAEVMGVELRRDPATLQVIEDLFRRRNRTMAASNARQADVPVGATTIPQRMGTAPGLVCPVGDKVVYALPGVPDEMKEMVERAVLPDLRARSGETAVIASRTLRTWGITESGLSEIVAPRVEALEHAGPGAATIAFLASGIEGIKVRLTVKAPHEAAAAAVLDREESELRALLGNAVFGIDDQTMEQAVGALLVERGLRLAVAESFTGGLVASRIVAVPGASSWFAGGVVTYASESKHRILDVPEGPVVSGEAAAAMAEGVRRLFGADVALATTGVAGPDPQEGLAPGTAFAGIALPGLAAERVPLALVGGRVRVREIGTITALDALRRRLLAARGA